MKASGSYASLMQGVSQQVPQDRQPGQHTEQINMLPDPVQGLSRRHGSRWVAEQQSTLSPSLIATLTTDTDNWRSFQYSNAGNDYVVLYRYAARPVGSTLPALIVYNQTTKAFLNYTRNVTDAQLDLLESGGISAMTAIGKYVFMAGKTTAPTATSTDLWAAAGNQQEAAVWIRGGAYARTYTVTATKTDNTVITFLYKTPTSSYPSVLDTSAVPVYAADPAGGTNTDTESCYIKDVAGTPTAELSWKAWAPTTFSAKKGAAAMTNVTPSAPANSTQYAWVAGAATVTFHSSNLGATDVTMTYTHTKTITNPNYAKTVTDITNAFNSAVTNWIGTAAEAITPAAIAEQLRLAAVTAGLTGGTRTNATLYFSNVKALFVNDGGDGSLMRGVANEITSIDQVCDVHKVGKIVKVRARNSKEVFYLKATAKDANVVSGYTEVTWVEGAGTEHVINNALFYATVSGGNVYVASTATLMTAILAGTHPDYLKSTCGDVNSSPLPFFIGKTITYLGIFQDRLLVGAGAVVRASKIGDYLNFFRSSVLTAPADDPLEMLSQGSDDDILRFGVIYDRDLVIFADRRQYAISGRSALTPTSANMQVMSSHANAAPVPPLSVGSVIFYGQVGATASSVHQIQPGMVAESPESFIQASQIDTYLKGTVIELTNHAKPTHLFVRTSGSRNSIFCFSYLDKEGQGRVQSAWSRWDFDAALGPVIGMARTPDGLLMFTMRVATDFGGTSRVYLVADLCPLTTGLSTYPYLDSIRPLAQVTANTGSVHTNTASVWNVAFDNTSQWQFVGDSLANRATLLAAFPTATGPQVGCNQTASITPTNPFVRDKNDKAITSGNLTIGKIIVGMAKSSGFWSDITARGVSASLEYSARVIGSPDDLVGRETVTTYLQSVPIAYETRGYTLTLRARKWFPFTLTTLEWVGQWFNRTQRF